MSFVSNFIVSQMSEKLKKRTHFYSNFDEFKAVERSKLPKEYGGTTPMKEMIGEYLIYLTSTLIMILYFFLLHRRLQTRTF